ncbi:hypothetical protein JKF63_02807 [Porcisia hertigi]|uniref:Non-specific serine/threonine protein kinase n=1 Tax=Porcisia hertigi TaxID=2761500 RepID=A0A836IIM6_9TRYP|nr:hypothetical protein JKF63_02807 [Porcisia hertigi]
MRGAGVCLAVLLACASSTHRDQAAATRQLLRAVTSVVGGGEQTQQGCRGGDDVVALLRHWWQGAIGGVMLARHAQLVRATLRCANSPLTEPSGGETPPCDPLVTQSPAAQFAAWWESQSITQVTSHALPPHLRETCYWTGKRGRRLCNTVAHLIAKSATSSCGVASEKLVSLKVPSMADAETVRVACAATYDVWSLQHICHLALASSEVADPSLVTASSMTPALHLPAVCALVTTEAGGALLESDLRSDDGVTSIFAHAMSAAWEAGDGALTVLQRSQGRPLTDQQHESLVEALRDFSKQRRVAEAVALFYAHERQHRRLRLPEVELFAETAKRAPLAFLVRVLLYVPPPCESAVLAKAIIAGAWKAYQRVLHQYSRRRAAPARGGPSRVSSLDAPSRRRVEQAWYESVAVARRALSLLPRTGNAKRCGEEDLFWILSILRRLMYARPRSLQICMPPPRASSTSMGTAVSVDEWDHVAVQSSQLVAALLQSSSGSEPVHHTLQGASVRQAIEEICQTTNYCDANGDATTAVQAYLRFSRFCSWSPPHRPSTLAAAQAAPNSRSSMPCSTHDWTVPLLPLDTSVSLLRQASTHMVTAYDDDVFAHAVPTSLSPSPPRRSVTLAALVAYVEAHQGPSVASAPEAPCSGAAPMQDTLEGQSRDADTELTMLRQLRAACEESGPAQPDIVAEAAVDGSALANMCGRAAIPGNERHHVKSNSTPACATAAAATRRARAYAVNCIAAVERLSPTLPATLRRALHADSALIPLTAILHDALRCCRLRPRSMPVRDGDAAAVDELDTMSLHSLTDRVDSDDPAAADVLARLIAAMFGLDGGETGEAVHDARLSHSSSHAAGDMPASDGSPVSMLVVVVRRTFVCRAARADLEFWRLAQHGDALLGYIWEYVWELYRLESTVLWVSPAQQQRAYLAVAECAQVIVAALQALDTWVAKMHSCEVRERGHNSDGDGVDHQVQGAACLKAAQDSLPDTASGEQGSRHSVDEWRVGLRSGTLQRVHTRLLEDADFPIDAGGRLGAVLPTWLSSSGLPPSGMAVTTSTAIAYVTTVIQHSRIAIENCSPASALMQLAVDPIAATSPTPADNPLGRGVISSRGARELLSATTQQYYDAVSRLVSASLPAIDGAGPLLPITPCGLAEDSLSYILQCVTATAAIRPPCHHPRTLGTLTETEAGVATALVARVAATDCMLQHLASLLQQTLVFAVAQAGSSTASGELLRSLWSLSAALEYAVVLLDECVAFCALLDLETAAAASPSSELLGGSDESLEKPCPVMSSVNVSLLTEKELAHIRAQLRWLAATFVDLYASRWWGGVHARLPESTRARLWRRDEVRAQHLHISLVLHHHTSASSDANISARLASAAEALHQALSCHASAAAANGALGSQRRDFLDLDALLDEEGVEAAHCTVPTLRTLEHALLAYLSVMQRRPHGMSVGVPDQTTSVSITALEASFQRAVIARLPPRQATLLWRLFPALLDDGCCFPGALDSQPRGGNHVAPAPLLCSQGFFAEEPSIVMCAVPTRLWKHLAHLGDASKWEVHSRPFRGSSACTETHGMHSERLVVYAALLSRNPLVVMNVVRHPLVRHHVLAEVRQGRRAEAQDGAGTESASSLSIEPRCEWLKKLLLYAAENDLVAEAKFASSGEAGESSGSVTQRTGCGTPSRDSDGRPLSATTSSSPPDPPAFMLQPLREEFVSALVLAVLRDESLMSEGQMCGLAASASGSAPTADNPPLSLLKCLLPPSPPLAAMLSAQRRERVLLELVQYLGDVTPHAWRTAFRWITATPYPPAAHEQLLTFTLTETALQTEQERNTLSCAAATTLRRLRVALLSCGPWPPYAARRLLEYAARVQEAATVKAAATRELASDSETAAMPFPEARVLYQQLQLQPPEREQDDVASLSPSSITAAGVGATMPRQAGRFLVKSPLLMRPSTGAPSAIVGDTSHVDYPVVSVPLSAIQLACEEGARLTEALRSSTAPAAGTAAARIARRMCDLASAPSHTACVHLLSDDAFAQDLVATPDKCAASTLMLTWRTLLLRSAELDCGERGFFSSANVGAGVTVAEVRGWTQGLYRQEGGSRDQCSVTVLDVYALLFFTASRVHDACRAAPSPPLESGGSHWWISAQHQLSSLKREIAAYWAAVWADEVMPTEWMLRCTTATSHAKAIRARISEYCRSGADAYSTRSPRLGFVTLKDHLRRAQTRLETASQECPSSFDSSTQALRSSGTTRSSAAAELARIHGEAAVQLRDAGARMTSFTHSIVTNPSQTLEKSEEKAAATPMWSLWPPAGWETYRLWVYMGESLQQKTAAMFKLHNPVSVVMYLRMWQRTRASAQQTGQPDAYGTRPPQGAGKGVVTYHEVHGTAWALVPAMCSQAVQAAQPTRERGFSSGDRRRGSRSTLGSLMDAWCVADVFVRDGHVAFACLPCDGNFEASGGCYPTPRSSSGDGDACETFVWSDDSLSTAANTTPAGAGVVMQVLLDLVSLEDARLQRGGQQHRSRQRTRSPLHRTPSDDTLVLLSVLRQLRQRLLPPRAAAGTAASTYDSLISSSSSAKVLERDTSDSTFAVSPWAAHVPLSSTCEPSTPPKQGSGKYFGAGTDQLMRVVSHIGSAWHSYLHVLHLCGDGLLNRAAARSGRRASPSATTLIHVAHQVQRLVTLSSLGVWGTDSLVLSPWRSRLLTEGDAQRIICFQMRGLQRTRDHVNVLGWTLEQQVELQRAHQSTVATVEALCTLQRHYRHDPEGLREEGAHDAAATQDMGLATKPKGQATASVTTQQGSLNRVEQATAGCFYPALVRLLRQISVSHPSRAGAPAPPHETPESQRCSPGDNPLTGTTDGVETEVLTEFASAVATVSHRRRRSAIVATAESDKAAAALLAAVHSVLHETTEQPSGLTKRCHTAEAAHHSTPPTPRLLDGWRELHALLSAVVDAVQRRSRDGDQRLLLDFLRGDERRRLWPLASGAEKSYLDTLQKVVSLAASRPSPTEPPRRLVEAGLTLCALLQPWISFSSTSRESCSVEAALCLVTLALQPNENLEGDTDAAAVQKSHAASLSYLADVVLVEILHRKQAMRLSVRSIVLLGIIYSQLKRLKSERRGVPEPTRGGWRHDSRTAPPQPLLVDANNALLCRILNALGALSEQDAAEVRDAWMAERSIDAFSPVTSSAACGAPAPAPGSAAHTRASDKAKPGTGSGGPNGGERSGTHVIRMMYQGSLQVLRGGGIGGDAAEHGGGRWASPLLCAATRLRTWLACEAANVARLALSTASQSESSSQATWPMIAASGRLPPQVCVLEDVLCAILDALSDEARAAHGSRKGARGLFSGEKRDTWATRREWLACLRIYGLYSELRRTCTTPAWGWQYLCMRGYAQTAKRESPLHRHEGGCGDSSCTCVSDVASLLLELTVVAALSTAETWIGLQDSSAVSAARQIALLSAFVRCCDKLGTPLPSLPSPQRPQWWASQGRSLSSQVMVGVALPDTIVLGRVRVDAHAAVRHLATRLLCRLSDDRSPSTSSATNAFQDWRALLTPLQALQRVTAAFAVPDRSVRESVDGEAADGSVWLLNTPTAGLQWTQACPNDTSRDTSADHHRCAHHDGSVHGFYYATLRLLCRTAHLAEVPPPILLEELLCPLAGLERVAAETSVLPLSATEGQQQCAAQATERGSDGGAAVRRRKTINRLDVLANMAKRIAVSPALRVSPAAGGACGGDGGRLAAGWTTALLIFKVLAQIEDALYTQCAELRGDPETFDDVVQTNRTLCSPSDMFAARYADLLAQRRTHAADYLAFMLLVSRYRDDLLPVHEDAAASNSEVDRERPRRLRHAQLRHVIALAVPPAAVGSVMALFQRRPATHRVGAVAAVRPRRVPLTAALISTLQSHSSEQLQGEDRSEGANKGAGPPPESLTPDEATLVQRLHDLLQTTSRGKLGVAI